MPLAERVAGSHLALSLLPLAVVKSSYISTSYSWTLRNSCLVTSFCLGEYVTCIVFGPKEKRMLPERSPLTYFSSCHKTNILCFFSLWFKQNILAKCKKIGLKRRKKCSYGNIWGRVDSNFLCFLFLPIHKKHLFSYYITSK